ncbi:MULTISPECIES: helix-turn-helix domain-containing protein [Enterococcus]|uniref:helix-turn-helix domain-containing protein n=1 Tax=Enterococcus TaxID=1350 RepID=UPI00349FFFEF
MNKQSVAFLILEHIFLHQYASLSDLSRKLFISESTLRRGIYRINKIWKEYGFYIDPNHMDILGDEKKIICFFIVTYSRNTNIWMLYYLT